MNGQESDELFSTLVLKKELLKQMLGMVEESKELLNNDQIDKFQANDHSVQTIIRQIDALNESLPVLKKKYGAGLNQASVIDIKKDIKDTLNRIIKINDENNRLAEKKLEEYKTQIRNMNQTKKGLGAYANGKAQDAIFIDAKK